MDVTSYAGRVRQLIARLVLLVAVLLMPLGMAPAAAGPVGHQRVDAMPMGHCDQQGSKHAPKAGFAECTMACSAALPAADLSRDEAPPAALVPLNPVAAAILLGLHPDTATPPPKPA